MIYHLATKLKTQIAHRLSFVLQNIVAGKLDTTNRIDAGLDYLLHHVNEAEINSSEFEKACGVGINVTPEQIEQAVEGQVNIIFI